jgi:multicomponent Na+:H+ antiporter subunit G
VTVLAVAFVSAGIFFLVAGAAGLLRFPDFYTRMHASGKCDTLGALLVLVGIACHEGASLTSVKILFIAGFIFLASPTATHAIARSALRHQNALWPEEEQ